LNVAAKIWLAIGIFVLGFVFCTALAYVQGRNTEQRLENTSEALFPAALRSEEAEASFHRTVVAFGEAVVIQDRVALERALSDGRHVVECLEEIAGIPGLTGAHAQNANSLAATFAQFLLEAHDTYGKVLAGP